MVQEQVTDGQGSPEEVASQGSRRATREVPKEVSHRPDGQGAGRWLDGTVPDSPESGVVLTGVCSNPGPGFAIFLLSLGSESGQISSLSSLS